MLVLFLNHVAPVAFLFLEVDPVPSAVVPILVHLHAAQRHATRLCGPMPASRRPPSRLQALVAGSPRTSPWLLAKCADLVMLDSFDQARNGPQSCFQAMM